MSDALRYAARAAFQHILVDFRDDPPRLDEVRWKMLLRYDAYEFTARFSNGSCFTWVIQSHVLNHRDLERATPTDNPLMGLYADMRAQHLRERVAWKTVLEARREWMSREATQLAQYYDYRFTSLQEQRRQMLEEQSIVRRLLGTLASTEDPETRAITALKDWLTPAQCQQYEKSGHFDVIGCDSKKRYRIYSASTFNIICQDDEVYCLTLAGNLPLGDNMLMQAIALELDETAALAVANRRSAAMPPDIGLNVALNQHNTVRWVNPTDEARVVRWDRVEVAPPTTLVRNGDEYRSVATEDIQAQMAMVERAMTPEQRQQIISDLIQAQDRMMRETMYGDRRFDPAA